MTVWTTEESVFDFLKDNIYFYIECRVQTGSGGHPASIAAVVCSYFSAVKADGQ
jgi:hypothetical protein